jgi:hypothetical protein
MVNFKLSALHIHIGLDHSLAKLHGANNLFFLNLAELICEM